MACQTDFAILLAWHPEAWRALLAPKDALNGSKLHTRFPSGTACLDSAQRGSRKAGLQIVPSRRCFRRRVVRHGSGHRPQQRLPGGWRPAPHRPGGQELAGPRPLGVFEGIAPAAGRRVPHRLDRLLLRPPRELLYPLKPPRGGPPIGFLRRTPAFLGGRPRLCRAPAVEV